MLPVLSGLVPAVVVFSTFYVFANFPLALWERAGERDLPLLPLLLRGASLTPTLSQRARES